MMMVVSVFAMILLGIASLYSAGLMKEGAKDDRRIVAEQMMIYHAAAARYCAAAGSSCTGGAVATNSVRKSMASFRSAPAAFDAMNRRMRSLVVQAGMDATSNQPILYVVTYLSDATTPGMASALGDLGAELRADEVRDTGIWNGTYVKSTGRISVAGGVKYWPNADGSLTPVQKPVVLSPQAGLIPDRSPVVVSRI